MSFASLVTAADRAAQDHLGGVTAVYEPAEGEAVEVPGMFDERFVIVAEGRGGAGVEQVTPAFFVKLSDLPVHPDDDEPTITIGAVSYRVRARQPDGMGGIMLLLHRVLG